MVAKPLVPAAEPECLGFPSAKALHAWLKKNHARPEGIWLRIAKKDAGVASVSYAEAVDAGLCWGWIDGQRKSLDALYFTIRFTPRRPRSMWSRINRDRAVALLASGAVQAPGLAQIERAKADGRWDAAYEPASRMVVPPDLEAAFDANPGAASFFGGLDSTNRYAVLHRIATAVKPETRAARIEKFVTMLARGEKIYS